MLEIAPDLLLPDQELNFTASRSSGPGGQNVNKVSSRVTLTFDVAHSPSLGAEQRARIMERLAGRISKDGVLRVVSQRHRTQGANRAAALERFVELLRGALAEQATRVPTRLPRVAKEQRLRAKKQHARIKRERSASLPADD
jgi:ribosome-associated protein